MTILNLAGVRPGWIRGELIFGITEQYT